MDRFHRLLSTQVGRRRLLIGAGIFTGGAIASQWQSRVIAQPKFSDYPFSLGIASGDPLPNSVVLWTRLAPDPLNGGGMPNTAVSVQWQIAEDEKMKRVVSSGTAIAYPEYAHTVHVDVQGLRPDSWYWYQFKVGNEVSPVGRTRTAPGFGYRIDRFRYAFASCQNWEQGYYAAYRDMAQQDLDLVVHLGDYIYEGEINPRAVSARQYDGPELMTLEEYRNRYALYKSDKDLQAAHAAFPWIVTWDDHEVENNYAEDIPQDGFQQEGFLQRRAYAYQAYWEHQPLRPALMPVGPDMPLYRRFTFGDLVEFNVLDTRQYRSDQPCGDGIKPRCPEAYYPWRTMTGAEQLTWLFQGLTNSQTRWNILAQQVVFAQHDWEAGPQDRFNLDAWDGYVAARSRILNFLKQRQPSNPVVITGDTHSSWVNQLKADFSNPDSPTVGTEFVGTSITSDFGASDLIEAALPENPWVKYFNGRQRGYVLCDLNRERWLSHYRLLPKFPPKGPTVPDPNAQIADVVSFVLPNQGVVQRA